MWLAKEAISAKRNSLNFACIQAALLCSFIITACSLENGVAVTTLLGGKINLNCSTIQPSEEIIMVKWSRSNRTMMKDIIAYSAPDRLFNFLNDDRVNISSSDGTCLQIQPVKFADDGNYTCEISAHQGVFRKHFFLSIIAPPVIALNISFLPNGKKKVRCIASKGKPAATIAWKESIVGNCTYTLTDNDDGTVTVESQLITANKFTREEQICIINHPAFNEVQNHTIYLGLDIEDNTGSMSLQLMYILIICASATALGMVMLTIWIIKRKRRPLARIIDNTQQIHLPVPHSGRRQQPRGSKDPIYQNTYCMKRSQHSD